MTILSVTVVQPGPSGPPGTPGIAPPADLIYAMTAAQPYQVVWDANAIPNAQLTITGTLMMTAINVTDGAYYALRTVQDSKRPYIITWDVGYHWPGGAANAVQPTQIAGAIDCFHFRGAPGNVLEFMSAQQDLKA
jgi:hypothetical protein